MKHLYFTDTKQVIPYNKSLREYTGNIGATILMQRLEVYFEKHPDGFFKFIDKDSKSFAYKETLSWEEELGFSVKEFHATFAYIGMRHLTQEQYNRAKDKFFNEDKVEKYYCSYFDKLTGLTHFFRNNYKVDLLIEKLMMNAIGHRHESLLLD